MEGVSVVNVTGPYWLTINIGSGSNDLVLPGNKPLTEPMLTQCYP